MNVIRLSDFENPTDTRPSYRADANPRPVSRMLISESLRIFDLGAVIAAGASAYAIYVLPGPTSFSNRYPGTILLGALAAGIVAQFLGAYRLEAVFSRSLGAHRAISAWLVSFGLFLVIGFALKLSDSFSRVWAMSWLLSAAGLIGLGRWALSFMTLRWAQQGRFAFRTLIIGVGEQAAALAAHIAKRGDARTRIVGFVTETTGLPNSAHSHEVFRDYPIISSIDGMMALIREDRVDEVIIALAWSRTQFIHELTMLLATTPVRIRLAPDLAGLRFADRRIAQRAGLPMLTLFDRPISGWSRVLKLVEDQFIALIALAFLTPLMVVIMVAIKVDSSGPVFFKQRRYGFNDRLIEVWKFRTMRFEATDVDGALQATRGDLRVTRVGRILRKSSLDELPQLLNVLRGDMSIIGPRPHAIATKAEGRLFQDVVDRYAARHRVKPGITGWAQVNGWRGETETIDKIRKRVEYDLYYIDNWSVWLDLLIILRTFVILVYTRDAY
jgi:Undecaprenyl-phosphate glucose phosphotransferase